MVTVCAVGTSAVMAVQVCLHPPARHGVGSIGI